MSPAATRTLVATAVVAVLAALVAIDRPTPVVTRAPLVPGLRAADVTRLELRRGDRSVTVALAAGGARVIAPGDGAADGAAVADLLSTIVTARADRWARHTIAAPRAIVTLTRDRPLTLTIGEEVTATGQAWIAVGDRAALVPAWVARSLDRDPDLLRVRRLVPPGVATAGLEVHGDGVALVLAGAALVRRDGDGHDTRLSAEVRAELLARIAALELAQFGPGLADVAPADGELRVHGGAAPIELAWGAACADPGQRAVRSSIGRGCVRAEAIDAVLAAARAAAAAEAVAPVPLVAAAPLASIDVDGTRVERDGGGWMITAGAARRDADADAMTAVVATLAAPATLRPRGAADRLGAATWIVTTADGDRQTWRVRTLGADLTIARGDEPMTLVLHGAAAATLGTVGPPLRSRQPLRLDPTRVVAITATGHAPATIARGAVLGEWDVTAPPRTVATPAAVALPGLVAALTVDAWAPPARLGRVRRTLRLAVDRDLPIAVAVGAADATGCWITVDADAAGHVAATTCTALLAPLAAPPR